MARYAIPMVNRMRDRGRRERDSAHVGREPSAFDLRRRAQQACQRRFERAGALVPLPRIGIQRALDGLNEFLRQIRADVSKMVPLLPPMRGLDVFPGPPVDRIRVGDEVIEEHAEAVDVRRLRARLSFKDFRCEIERRPREIVHDVPPRASRSAIVRESSCSTGR